MRVLRGATSGGGEDEKGLFGDGEKKRTRRGITRSVVIHTKGETEGIEFGKWLLKRRRRGRR